MAVTSPKTHLSAERLQLPLFRGAGRIMGRELRAGRTSWFVWTIALSLVALGFMAVFSSMGSAQQFDTLIKGLPKGLATAFDYDRFSLATPIGYFATEPYILLALFAAFYAAIGGASILAKEESDKTAEFLMTRPVRRSAVVIGKAGALALFVFAMHAVLAVAVWAAFAWFAPGPHDYAAPLRLVGGSALASLAFAGVSIFVSAALDQARTALSAGIGLVWGLYIVKIVGALVGALAWLGYLTPFYYVDGAEIVLSDGPSVGHTLVLLGALVAGVAAATWAYERKEFRA